MNSDTNVLIELKDAVIYQGEQLVLNNVQLRINVGEFVYLIGKTGSGKSSLLKILYGDLKMRSGSGQVCGIDLNTLNWKQIPFLRRKLGIVFQDFQLLTDRNVKENLLFVLESTGWKNKKEMQHRCDEVLGLVGLDSKTNSMPFELSGGEQQRVVIARALLNNPPLVLADEPTGNLDPETSDEIILLLKKINKETKTSFFMATHDYYILEKFPSRIVQCQNGAIKDSQAIEVG